MLQLQLRILSAWWTAGEQLRRRIPDAGDDRGEVTAETAMTVLLVTAAITAGGIIAAVIIANAHKLFSP